MKNIKTMKYQYFLFLYITIAMSASTILAIMDCLKNRDCLNRHEHLCNMQNGMWTRNYVLTPKNNTLKVRKKMFHSNTFPFIFFHPQIFFIQLYRYVEQLDSCFMLFPSRCIQNQIKSTITFGKCAHARERYKLPHNWGAQNRAPPCGKRAMLHLIAVLVIVVF